MRRTGTDRGPGNGLAATLLDALAALRSVLAEEIAMRIPAAIDTDQTIRPVTPRR